MKLSDKVLRILKCSMFSCIIILGLFITSLSVRADELYTLGNYQYTVEDNSVTIVCYTGTSSVVDVPCMIVGNPVNIIASGAFSNNTYVDIVNLPDTIMEVMEGAFSPTQTVNYITGNNDANTDTNNNSTGDSNSKNNTNSDINSNNNTNNDADSNNNTNDNTNSNSINNTNNDINSNNNANDNTDSNNNADNYTNSNDNGNNSDNNNGNNNSNTGNSGNQTQPEESAKDNVHYSENNEVFNTDHSNEDVPAVIEEDNGNVTVDKDSNLIIVDKDGNEKVIDDSQEYTKGKDDNGNMTIPIMVGVVVIIFVVACIFFIKRNNGRKVAE